MLVSVWRGLMRILRTNFIAGLFIAAPLGVTIAVLAWVWDKINEPLANFFNLAAGPKDATGLLGAILNSEYQKLIIPLLGLVLLIVCIILIGVVARSIIGRIVFNAFELAVSKVPVVGMLYTSVKQLGEAFISEDGTSKFQRAVAVQFPYKGVWGIGFVTGPAEAILQYTPEGIVKGAEPMLTVFVPMTPMPTGGFMIIVPQSETRELRMTVQDALKLVISGGMIGPSESQKMLKQNLPVVLKKRESQRAIQPATE